MKLFYYFKDTSPNIMDGWKDGFFKKRVLCLTAHTFYYNESELVCYKPVL